MTHSVRFLCNYILHFIAVPSRKRLSLSELFKFKFERRIKWPCVATVQPTGFERFNKFTAMVRIEVHFKFRSDWFDHRRDSWFDRTVRCRGQGSHLASPQPPPRPPGARLPLSPPMLSANHKPPRPTHHDPSSR